MPLHPSVSRLEYGTLAEWHECLEALATFRHGTLQRPQYEWIEVFGTLPPAACDIELDAAQSFRDEDRAAADEADRSGYYGDLGCRGVVRTPLINDEWEGAA